MNELSKRILTALMLVTVIVGLIFKAPDVWFVYFLVIVALIGLYEFSKLTQLKSFYQLGIIAVAMVFLTFDNNTLPHGKNLLPIITFLIVFLVITAFWLKNLFLVLTYPDNKPLKQPLFQSVNIILWLSALFGLVILNQNDKSLLVLLILIVTSADSFSYFSGRAFGKRKLAPNLSGGKTIEGVIGGVIGALGVTGVWLFVTDNMNMWFLLIAFFTALFSVIGDLYESIYKREAGVKDSGNILPGHGGILDRMDGMLAATPIFIIGISLL
ncbi:Phosphatidate cytidylyltransferase [uncultured Candidatus Thioglobus sp.]|nr:Phosphatidate cytidylyltransferase [uncultured Candidatus Thioglobus sp.]